MNRKTKIILVISVLVVGVVYWFYQQQPVGNDDIYVNRLVYLKSDSGLFTGTLKVADEASYYYESFCKGIPCGEYAEHQKGGTYVSKGKHIAVKKTLSEKTLQMLSNDTVVIDYWQEGGDLPSDPYHLTLLILRDDRFFQSDKKQYDNYIRQLAEAVLNDTRSLEYDYLAISFGDAVHDADKTYSKEYKVEAGKLLETYSE